MKTTPSHRAIWILTLAVTPVFASCARHTARGFDPIAISRSGHALKITGTFTNLRVTDQGVFGAEVRIASTAKPLYQAVIQFGAADACNRAELGTERCFRVSNLHLAEAVFDYDDLDHPRPRTNRVTFGIPGTDWDAGRFEGILTDEALEGTFTPVVGAPRTYKMVRSVSHWDR